MPSQQHVSCRFLLALFIYMNTGSQAPCGPLITADMFSRYVIHLACSCMGLVDGAGVADGSESESELQGARPRKITCVERSKADGIKQRTGCCHRGHAIAHGPESPPDGSPCRRARMPRLPTWSGHHILPPTSVRMTSCKPGAFQHPYCESVGGWIEVGSLQRHMMLAPPDSARSVLPLALNKGPALAARS
eukprot:365303-Chlamydomonas_euryale.AAC.49